MASNSLGTITPTLVAQRALEIMAATYPAITLFTSDFSDEGVKYGQTIYSRIPSVGVVADYDTANGYVAQTGTLTDVSVTINKHKHATVGFNSNEVSSTNLDLVEQYARSLAEGLGAQVMTDVAALFTSGNYSQSFVQASTGWNRKTVVLKGASQLNGLKIAQNDRFLIGNSTSMGYLWQDDSLFQAEFGGNGVENAGLKRPHGILLNEYQDLPTAQNLLGVVAQRSAIVFASRVPATFDAVPGLPFPGRVSVVKDPKTNLSVQVIESIDPKLGAIQVTYAIMYGVAKGNGSALVRVTSA